MRFEPRRAFTASRLLPFSRRSAPERVPLPPDLAVLKGYRSLRPALEAAMVRARREGVSASRALLAYGEVSETLYYRALANHLDLPFVAHWPDLATPFDVSAALARCAVRLGGERAVMPWLLAPTGLSLELLLEARRLGIERPAIAITTPSHLAAILRHRGCHALKHVASLALPQAAPRFSAKDRRVEAMVLAATLLVALTCLASWRILVDVVFGLVFLASMIFRLIVCARGLRQAPPTTSTIRDVELPFYSVLVPLYDEAAMVPHLLSALARLDYPRSKLEILVLIEADDTATRDALASHPRPSWLKVVAVPDGSPRTKPRALNVGLALARGSIVTVYDAEDRPQPDQLRRAAGCFKAHPEVVCLQARLAIGNGAETLLAGGIMEHLPQAESPLAA